MRSFQLHVGYGKYLTAAGWASLFVACTVTAIVAWHWTEWLIDRVGPGRPLILIVAGSGLATWGTSWLFFRAAGFELVTELDDGDDDES